MARDKLEEIAAKRLRGQKGAGWRGRSELNALESEWRRGDGPLKLPAQFIAIRLVTILEVFTRDWVTELVDAGDPYTSRAAELVKGSLKIDYAMAQALVGKQVSFGELVSHEIPVNDIGDIERAFSALIDDQLFTCLEGVSDRWAITEEGKPAPLIFPNPQWARQQLGRLFAARHVIVHELPDDRSDEVADIADFVSATCQFVEAVDQYCDKLLHGDRPLTQLEMNFAAAEKAEKAEAELQEVLSKLEAEGANPTLAASQRAWTDYRRHQAEFRSRINDPMPGSIAPMIYHDEMERISRARIAELDWYLTREEGDL